MFVEIGKYIVYPMYLHLKLTLLLVVATITIERNMYLHFA